MKLRPLSEELQRFKPKQELDLPPRLFRQLLNPYKQAAKLNEFSDEYASIHSSNCIATFWDNDKKRVVKLNLGYVNVRCNYLYRAASSIAELPCQNSNEVSQAVSLSRVEGAAPCDYSEDAENYSHLELAQKVTGTSVIPVQSLMGEPKHQNSGGGQSATGEPKVEKSC